MSVTESGITTDVIGILKKTQSAIRLTDESITKGPVQFPLVAVITPSTTV